MDTVNLESHDPAQKLQSEIRRAMSVMGVDVGRVQSGGPRDNLRVHDRKFIVIFKRGGMGSVLASAPFVACLRSSVPGAHIVFVTDRANRDLVDRCRIADDIVPLDDAPTVVDGIQMARLVRQIRRSAPAMFFDLQLHTYRRTSGWLALASGAARRVGFYRPGDRFRQRLFNTLVVANMFAPVHELYVQMARAIGCAAPGRIRSARLFVGAEDVQEATRLLGDWTASGQQLLVVNLNTSAKATQRRWPLAQFREAVAGILACRDDVRVALIGSAGECGYVEQLRSALGAADDRVRNFAGRTSFGGLLALLGRAHCLLTNDSGPFHFGVALGTPTVGLFGPVHPDHYGRMGPPDRTIIFYHPMVCSPCVHVLRTLPCRGDNQCMKAIAPAEVRDACLLLLSGPRSSGRNVMAGWHFPVPPQTTGSDGDALGVWHRPAGEGALWSAAQC